MIQIDTGDTVFHRPTREEWLVACVQGDHLSWCGWPEGMARLADCLLVDKATHAEREKLLRDMAATRRSQSPAATHTWAGKTWSRPRES
jgi:hypothetical protein